MDHTLTRPDRFTLSLPDGTLCRGADQDWYRDVWQRRAGCGPTAAATASKTRGDYAYFLMDTDSDVDAAAVEAIPGVIKVRVLSK